MYDRLVAEELVDEAPTGALRIARDDFEQDDVNKLLVDARTQRAGASCV